MDKIYFKYEDDIINPCWDNVFKAIFTKDTPESRGAQVLLTISKDERERARLTSEYKFAVDLQSRVVDARRVGTLEGVKQVAKNMLNRNRPIDEIVEDTGLTHDEVENLRNAD